MRTTLPAPIDSSGIVARRTKGAGLEAPNPQSGGLVAETPNLSMSFANEVYRRSGGELGGRSIFDAAAALLPGFAKPPVFAF